MPNIEKSAPIKFSYHKLNWQN